MKQNKYVIFYNSQGQSRFVMDFDPRRFKLDTTSNPDFAKRFAGLALTKEWRDKLNNLFPYLDFCFVRLKDIGTPKGYTVNLGNAMFVREDVGMSFNLSIYPVFARKYKKAEAERARTMLANRYNEPYFRVRPYWLAPGTIIY